MNKQKTLPGCTVLSPMGDPSAKDSSPARPATSGTANPPNADTASRRSPKHVERFATLNSFVDFCLAKLNRNEMAVWMILFRDTRQGSVRTSQADLARRAGVCDRTVRRAIKRLLDMGLLQVLWQGGLGRGASVYRIQGSSMTESHYPTTHEGTDSS